mgnify:CR=1 FL=1
MSFENQLVKWYKNNKRDLPWRKNNDPYSVWISEVILQQTRVVQGTKYYNEFLEKFPIISDIISDFLKFIGNDSVLVIHNAQFDMGFLNAELRALGRTPISMSRSIDTVKLAREKFPGAPASLDALCRRFKVDNSGRELHGALLDAELLSEVYLELIGGRQPDFELSNQDKTLEIKKREVTLRALRSFKATHTEKIAHKEFLSKLKAPIWFD